MNPRRYRAVDINERAQRIANFQHYSIEAVAEMLEAAGLNGPQDLNRRHIVAVFQIARFSWPIKFIRK